MLMHVLSQAHTDQKADNTCAHTQKHTLRGTHAKCTFMLKGTDTDIHTHTHTHTHRHTHTHTLMHTHTHTHTHSCMHTHTHTHLLHDSIDPPRLCASPPYILPSFPSVHHGQDLTRQLQHAKKRLESYENGSGDRDGTSMGSRTNSNGSLNSMDNSSNQQAAHHQGQANSQPANVQHSRPSQEPVSGEGWGDEEEGGRAGEVRRGCTPFKKKKGGGGGEWFCFVCLFLHLMQRL